MIETIIAELLQFQTFTTYFRAANAKIEEDEILEEDIVDLPPQKGPSSGHGHSHGGHGHSHGGHGHSHGGHGHSHGRFLIFIEIN